MSGLTLFAALGVLAAAAVPAYGMARELTAKIGAIGKPPVDSPASRAPRALARLCLGLSCLFAVAAAGEFSLSQQDPANSFDVPRPLPWGALWAHVFALLGEWRLVGLPSAGRRAIAGLLLAGAGVLFLGIGLTVWTNLDSSTGPPCLASNSATDINTCVVRGVAALGLALVPLAGIALGLARAAEPPLSAATASVVVAVWLQPALPALGWLPTSIGAGAALGVLLLAALIVLGFAASRGARETVGGLVGYFVLSVGGCTILGVL